MSRLPMMATEDLVKPQLQSATLPSWRSRWHLAALALPLALSAACFNPSYDQPRCGPMEACPSGTTCVDQVCILVEDPPEPLPPPAAGTWLWARSLSMVTPLGIAESKGTLQVSGYYSAPAELGTGVLTPVATDSVLATFSSADASVGSVYAFGGAGEEYGSLATLDGDAAMLYGVSYGAVDLGKGAVAGGGGPGADGFLGRYTSSGASWVTRIAGFGEDKLVGTALASPGALAVLGWFEGVTVFDGTAMGSRENSRDILFAHFDPVTGKRTLTRTFGSTGRDEGASLTATGGGEVVASGFFSGTLAFGGTAQPITSVNTPQGLPSLDVWVAKLSATGVPMWAVSFGGAGDDRGGTIVSDAAGDLYVTGTFSGAVPFGSITLTSAGADDLFLVKLSGATGAVQWATSIGSAEAETSGFLALDGAGHLLVTGTIAGPLETGGTHFGGLDAALASYDASTGTRRWLQILGTPGADRGWAVHAGAGAAYFGLSVAEPLNLLGPVPLVGAAAYTALMLKIAP